MPKLNDFDIDIDDDIPSSPMIVPSTQIEQTFEEETINETPINNAAYLDENGNPIEMTEDELEMMEEEARAERNRKAMGKKNNPISNMAKKVELPPKRKIEMAMADSDYESECECGSEEACDKCIDRKGF
jgi:hypothetical protein